MQRRRLPAKLLAGLLLATMPFAGAGARAEPPADAQVKAPPPKNRGARPRPKDVESILPTVEPDKPEDEAAIRAAIPEEETALAEKEKTLGPNHRSVADALMALGGLHLKNRAFDSAEPLFMRAVKIREKALGPDDLGVAEALLSYAVVRRKKRTYDGAEEAFLRALRIREKKKGAYDLSVAEVLNELGLLYRRKIQYDRAVLAFQRAISIREDALGKEHIEVAVPQNHLAMIYWARGEYTRAEPLLLHVLAVREKMLGPEHPDVAGALKNLAIVCRDEGQYERAEALFQRSIAILEAALGPNHYELALPLINFAKMYRNMRRLERAEPLLKRALTISEMSLGPDHPDVAHALTELGVIYSQRGNDPRAEPLLQQALTIFEKAYGPNHPYVADALNNLAIYHLWRGDRPRGEPLLLRALSIQEQTTGVDSLAVANTLSTLSTMYLMAGMVPEAARMRTRGGAIRERLAELFFGGESEEAKQLYLVKLQKDTDATVSLHAFSAPSDPGAARLALTTILRRKGRILDAMTDSLLTLRSHLTPQGRKLLDRRSAVVTELSRQASHVDDGAPTEAQRAQRQRLDDELKDLERQISVSSAEFRAERRAISIEDVQAAIPPGKALLETFRYRPFEPQAGRVTDHWGAYRYVVYRLRHEGAVEAIDLGEAAPIDAMVEQLRTAISNPTRDPKKAARALDQAVMRPVRRLLTGVRDVWVSPDGALNLVPFHALVDEDGRYLIERYTFTYLTSGRDLIRLQAETRSRETPAVMANPAFGPLVSPDVAAKSRGGPLSGVVFPPLAGTAIEAAAIGKQLDGARVFTGEAATETRLKSLHGPTIVHIATHGFFLPDPDQGRAPPPSADAAGSGGSAARTGSPQGPQVVDSLLRAGLAFAGANQPRRGADDGILTALEAAALDLYGTKLIVLSACETGVGDVSQVSGDGVYGLRRALVMAGAETQVMSLWKVDDDATRQMMVAYYAELDRGVGRSEAMRKVEMLIRMKRETSHPYYWASFIVSGASTPLVFSGGQGVPGVGRGLRGNCACAEVGGAGDSGVGAALGAMALGLVAARRRRAQRVQSLRTGLRASR